MLSKFLSPTVWFLFENSLKDNCNMTLIAGIYLINLFIKFFFFLINIFEICIWKNILDKYSRELANVTWHWLQKYAILLKRTVHWSLNWMQRRIVQKASFPLCHGSFGYIWTFDPKTLGIKHATLTDVKRTHLI